MKGSCQIVFGGKPIDINDGGGHHVHMHQFSLDQLVAFNSSHWVRSLAFGPYFPGLANPLDNTTRLVESGPTFYFFFSI